MLQRLSLPQNKCRKGASTECGRFVKVAKAIILPMITQTISSREKSKIHYFYKRLPIYIRLKGLKIIENVSA